MSSTKYVIGKEYDWKGGNCPVPSETIVTITLRAGNVFSGQRASSYRWEHYISDGDIVKFSVFRYPDYPDYVLNLPEEVEATLIEDSKNASYAPRVMTLYHATTPAKAKKYRDCGAIHGPVRGFTTLQAAMAWALKVNRTVIYEIFCEDAHKLPDHHNRFGDAWWNDGNVTDFKCVFSADSDA